MCKLPVTNPKQSEKLKKLGLDGVMTADMMWIYANTKEPYLTELSKDGKTRILDLTRRIDALPAWTERTLMDMLPEEIGGYRLRIYPRIMNGKRTWYISYHRDPGMVLKMAANDDLMAAVIEMLQWLVKTNRINKMYLSNEKEKSQICK